MYIRSIKLHNFKGFAGDHEIVFDKGMNFFVGDNNCGKTTIFRAIDFIQTGGKMTREDFITNTLLDKEDEFVSAEIKLCGNDIVELLKSDTLKKYSRYLIKPDDNDNSGEATLRLLRSSKEEEVVQAGKVKKLSMKNVRVFNPESRQFENPTGIDTTISALFELQPVWADTSSNDITNFASNKICGKIIDTIIKGSVIISWPGFKKAHSETFKEITDKLKPTEEEIQKTLSEQYGCKTEVELKFDMPEVSDFLKNGSILLGDIGNKTNARDKGTGMQRVLALSIIQVYANMVSVIDEQISRPIFFLIDEPETFLHPKAQRNLLDALEKISEHSQIFLTTHSPYLLTQYKKETHQLHIFSRDIKTGLNDTPNSKEELALFGKSSPTWGEINYYAFGIATETFHNELYGFIQAKAISQDSKNEKEEDFDKYLNRQYGIKKDREWKRLLGGQVQPAQQRTLQTYIRNFIHHPENDHNEQYTQSDLEQSIAEMVDIAKDLYLNKLNNKIH